ncbi:hypothetical protein EDD11_007813 [Mortierella claussenii]|nr:hypothetical protein EDD11_007813 [Mortierella claussenii]
MLLQQALPAHGVSGVFFWEDGDFGGMCTTCPIFDYNQCYELDAQRVKPSGFKFRNDDFLRRTFSLTFYNDRSCKGWWFRKSVKVGYMGMFRWPTLGDWNDNIQSFKVANFEMSDTIGHNEEGEPSANVCYIDPFCPA